MSIKPLHDHVLVQRNTADEKTPGGLFIPDTAKEKLNRGRVVAVGPGRLLDNGARLEPRVRKDDEIIFGKYSGTEFEHEGETNLLMLREDDIFAVVEAG